MSAKRVGVEDLISAMKKMAVEKGLKKEELQDYLDKYAFRFGATWLLKILAGVDFRLEAGVNTLEYSLTKRPAVDVLAEEFNPGEKILSIGCGTGLLEANLARLGCRVWGLEKNKDLIGIARKLADEMGLSQSCKFRRVKRYKYPFPDGFFDAALYSRSLHEIKGKTATLRGVYRVLKDLGRVAILETKSELKEMNLEKIAKNGSFKRRGVRVVLPAKGRDGLVGEVRLIVFVKK